MSSTGSDCKYADVILITISEHNKGKECKKIYHDLNNFDDKTEGQGLHT